MKVEKGSATELIRTHTPVEKLGFEEVQEGICAFCDAGVEECVAVDDVINHKYFTDYDLMTSGTECICKDCAYCMLSKPLKQGHWIVHENGYESPSTGDLVTVFDRLEEGDIQPPFAFHISANPILSEHAYLWTPICYTDDEFVVDYDGQVVRCCYSEFSDVMDAVEVLRFYGFRLDEIRSGEARVSKIRSIGYEGYMTLNRYLNKYRRTALLELVITVSQSADNQQRDSVSDKVFRKYE